MATIDNKKIIDNIIKNDGYYEDDPRVAMIVEYENVYGSITWGVTWSNEPKQYQRRYLIESTYINNPKIIWEAK